MKIAKIEHLGTRPDLSGNPYRALSLLRTVGEFGGICYLIEMTKEKAASGANYSFEELAIWQTQLPNVKHAILPPHTNRPNAVVREGNLYVPVFSSGAVCALDSKTGQLLWRREKQRE